MSLLTEQEITEIVREAARGSATRRDGSTSQRIARAIEAKVIEKIKAQGVVMWYYRHFDRNTDEWGSWQRVEPRNPFTDTVADRVEELQEYIRDGYKYELLPLYRLPEGD